DQRVDVVAFKFSESATRRREPEHLGEKGGPGPGAPVAQWSKASSSSCRGSSPGAFQLRGHLSDGVCGVSKCAERPSAPPQVRPRWAVPTTEVGDIFHPTGPAHSPLDVVGNGPLPALDRLFRYGVGSLGAELQSHQLYLPDIVPHLDLLRVEDGAAVQRLEL